MMSDLIGSKMFGQLKPLFLPLCVIILQRDPLQILTRRCTFVSIEYVCYVLPPPRQCMRTLMINDSKHNRVDVSTYINIEIPVVINTNVTRKLNQNRMNRKFLLPKFTFVRFDSKK